MNDVLLVYLAAEPLKNKKNVHLLCAIQKVGQRYSKTSKYSLGSLEEKILTISKNVILSHCSSRISEYKLE